MEALYIYNILSDSDIEYIQSQEGVINAYNQIVATGRHSVYFNIQINDSILVAINSHFGLNLTTYQIPMRYIKGDTLPHIDSGSREFEHTYLLYLTESPGSFIINNETFPITKNSGFKFNEGLLHSTINKGSEPRLLIGPMNEFAQPVGESRVFYYPTLEDALAVTNPIADFGSYTIMTLNDITRWIVAENSTGSSRGTYSTGDLLNESGYYYLYPALVPCFLEGTQVLCLVDNVEKWLPIQSLGPDTIVKTYKHGPKKISLLGQGTIYNQSNDLRIKDRLYKCSMTNYPELNQDLYITGCHSLLVDNLTDIQRKETIEKLNYIFITDNKYRLIACVDSKAEPWNKSGRFNIYHLALEHNDDGMNYGIYVNGGLLVETCAIRTLKNKSNMKLLF